MDTSWIKFTMTEFLYTELKSLVNGNLILLHTVFHHLINVGRLS